MHYYLLKWVCFLTTSSSTKRYLGITPYLLRIGFCKVDISFLITMHPFYQ